MERKWIGSFAAAVCAALLLCGCLCPAAGAAVAATPEATGRADSVYVAGNPDWYPIEYYDPAEKCYKGILPEILERIGEQTGLRFTYVLAGEEDQRLRLAKNGQVELVSGYARDAEELRQYGMTGSSTILTVSPDGQRTEVCFAFTGIAGEGLVDTVEKALASISDQEAAGIAIGFVMENAGTHLPRWLLPAGAAALVLAAVVIIILAVQRHRYKKAAERDKRYDLVTGIWNKEYFAQQFEKAIPEQYRGIYCVVFIGFDIGRVNQYYGEAEAEAQLCFAANELMKSTADNEIAARVSGGGFAVARPSSGKQEAGAWTEALLSRLNQYCERYGKDYHPEFRAGIYMLQPMDRDCETVLFNARQGYQTALGGNADYAFSHMGLIFSEKEKLQLKKQTLEAIQNREFKMFLQFIVQGSTRKIVSAEALSRWDHPQKGLLYPGSYVDLMESEGTVGELDFYIFEEACRQLERWEKEGRRMGISCNFTRITIDRENFVSHLQEIADRYFFDHSRLVIEITEDAMESSKRTAFDNVFKCKSMGFRIALDDAGSGYTSFADLRDYPIDIVKIDRSILISAVEPRGIALLKGMIALVHSMQMDVLCEGVETAQQVDLLRQLGCDYMQGYYFYRALPCEEVGRLLNAQGRQTREASPDTGVCR